MAGKTSEELRKEIETLHEVREHFLRQQRMSYWFVAAAIPFLLFGWVTGGYGWCAIGGIPVVLGVIGWFQVRPAINGCTEDIRLARAVLSDRERR